MIEPEWKLAYSSFSPFNKGLKEGDKCTGDVFGRIFHLDYSAGGSYLPSNLRGARVDGSPRFAEDNFRWP